MAPKAPVLPFQTWSMRAEPSRQHDTNSRQEAPTGTGTEVFCAAKSRALFNPGSLSLFLSLVCVCVCVLSSTVAVAVAVIAVATGPAHNHNDHNDVVTDPKSVRALALFVSCVVPSCSGVALRCVALWFVVACCVVSLCCVCLSHKRTSKRTNAAQATAHLLACCGGVAGFVTLFVPSNHCFLHHELFSSSPGRKKLKNCKKIRWAP